MTPELETSLIMVADAIADAADPWWIIGSAAVVLHGAETIVHDIDLLMSRADASCLLQKLGVDSMPDGDHPQFRSSIFGIWSEPPLPVEIFADFSLATESGWQPVGMHSSEQKIIAERKLFVPAKNELHALLLSFGRPKDVDRARLLGA